MTRETRCRISRLRGLYSFRCSATTTPPSARRSHSQNASCPPWAPASSRSKSCGTASSSAASSLCTRSRSTSPKRPARSSCRRSTAPRRTPNSRTSWSGRTTSTPSASTKSGSPASTLATILRWPRFFRARTRRPSRGSRFSVRSPSTSCSWSLTRTPTIGKPTFRRAWLPTPMTACSDRSTSTPPSFRRRHRLRAGAAKM
mmetsp:Transcript_69147/g.193247  ORF Transcript_69147/g.193247 Transcript_69147/m.193247 type:complete len:201 (+) Transcript_69147:3751-4353(+)